MKATFRNKFDRASTLSISSLAAALAFLQFSDSARADISGFGGNGTGWTLNGTATVSANALQLTTESTLEAGSAFYNTPQNINSFSTSFSYQATHLFGGDTADGMVFVLQNQGPTALGSSGGYLGYTGISSAAGVAFNLLNSAPAVPGTGYAATSVPYNYQSVAPVNMMDLLNITLSYNGTTLNEFIKDTVNGNTYSTSYTVNLASAVGGSTAYIGFTGGTGLGTAQQVISNFSYAVPEPGCASIACLGLAIMLVRRARNGRRTGSA